MQKVKVDLIRKLLRTRATARVTRIVTRLDPPDIADLFGSLSPGESVVLIDVLVKNQQAASTLAELPPEFLPSILSTIETAKVAGLLAQLPPDDAALLLAAVPTAQQNEVLGKLPKDARTDLEHLLIYPEDSAGRLMNPRVLTVPISATAHDAIDALRASPDAEESIFQLFVTDTQEHLVGVVPPQRLLLASPETPLRDICVADPVTVRALDDKEDVAQAIARYDLVAVPVVDDHFRLIGVVTVDDAIDILRDEATEDIYRFAGLDEGDRVFSTPLQSVRRRLPWNFLNMLTALVAANVVGAFEATIHEMVALATFLPVVAGMGGNTGTQSLTVVTRAIALGELSYSSAFRAITKELIVGVLIGTLMGMVVGGVAWLWKGNPMLGIVLWLAMVANLTLAGLMGAAIPLGLKWAGQDPALGGGIVLTAVTDSVGFLCFLGLASALLL